MGIATSLRRLMQWLGSGHKPLPPIRPTYTPAAAPTVYATRHSAPPAAVERPSAVKIFDPAHPVENRRSLFGRDEELDELLEATMEVGQHVIVHGPRGSGKTSLVRVFGDYADQRGAIVLYSAAEPGASFGELIRPFLREIPSHAIDGSWRSDFERMSVAPPEEYRARGLVDLFTHVTQGPMILILDEFDRVTDEVVKSEVAAFMKLLSDALSKVQLILVGIAGNVREVIGSHPSLRRHMRAIPVGRISPSGVEALIESGERALNLRFDSDARQLIEATACGSPYHVRLFCSHTAAKAMRGGGTVDLNTAIDGLASATRAWRQMNDEDVLTFSRAILTGDARELEQLAREAGSGDGSISLSEDARRSTEIDRIREALEPTSGESRRLSFKDSVAPQFLLAMLAVQRFGDGATKFQRTNVRAES